ncbi:MAG: ABC transporter ATP-binding protein, partial [Pirellulaceae bacterium]
MSCAVAIDRVSHRYGQRQAVVDLTLEIATGEIFVLLGPNGSGKTTLFRLLSTMLPLQQGNASLLGYDLRRQMQPIRERIGVVFQSPSLDRKLTVTENIRHQAALYGLFGGPLRQRLDEMLDRFGLANRAHERVERLSGGLRRRVELAKGMIHRPQLLLLDEPSTGLDPGARSDLWIYLKHVRDEGVTVVLTTHILEEGEQADRIGILNAGKLVALDTPDALRRSIGGDALMLDTP